MEGTVPARFVVVRFAEMLDSSLIRIYSVSLSAVDLGCQTWGVIIPDGFGIARFAERLDSNVMAG